MRMPEDLWHKRLLKWVPLWRRKCGRSSTSRNDIIRKSMNDRNLQEEVTDDRETWRRGLDIFFFKCWLYFLHSKVSSNCVCFISIFFPHYSNYLPISHVIPIILVLFCKNYYHQIINRSSLTRDYLFDLKRGFNLS